MSFLLVFGLVIIVQSTSPCFKALVKKQPLSVSEKWNSRHNDNCTFLCWYEKSNSRPDKNCTFLCWYEKSNSRRDEAIWRRIYEVGVVGAGEGEEEEEVGSWGTFEEERREALKMGNPVCCLHRRQKAIVVLKKTETFYRGNRVAEVAWEHGWHLLKSLDSDENFKPEHTLFCRELRFVAIYALFLEIFGQKKCLFG